VADNELRLQRLSELVKGSPDDAEDKVIQLIEKNRRLEKELQQLKGRLASSQGSDLAARAVEVGGIKVLAARLEGADNRVLRETMDQLKNKLGSAAVVLGTVTGNKVSIIAGVTKDQTERLKAGELVNVVASQVGGRGGGRPDMAQAGGNQPENLDAALQSVTGWVTEKLSA
jgi:alanyl-tRNA synthetase